MTSHISLFAQGKAKLFSEELIEYVLEDFGHVWKAARSNREKCLRENSMFTFTPEIGQIVAYLSIKHGGFVVTVCYNSWKYIKSHRVSVMEELLFNDIVSLCSRCQLDNDGLGLFVFMSIVAEYARFVIVDEQKHLLEAIVKALSYCLLDIIPGGYINILHRMQYRASTFKYPEAYIKGNYDYRWCFARQIADSENTLRREFESSLNYTFDMPISTLCDTPMKEILEHCELRELHRNLHKQNIKAQGVCVEGSDGGCGIQGTSQAVPQDITIAEGKDGENLENKNVESEQLDPNQTCDKTSNKLRLEKCVLQ